MVGAHRHPWVVGTRGRCGERLPSFVGGGGGGELSLPSSLWDLGVAVDVARPDGPLACHIVVATLAWIIRLVTTECFCTSRINSPTKVRA